MGFTEGQSGHLAKHDAIDTLTATHTSQIAAGDVTNPASAAAVAVTAALVADQPRQTATFAAKTYASYSLPFASTPATATLTTVSGTATYGVPAKFGNAAGLAAATTLQVPTYVVPEPSTDSITIECWFYGTTIPSGLGVVWSVGGGLWLAIDSATGFAHLTTDGSNAIRNTVNLCDTVWHHLAVEISRAGGANTLKGFWIDGALVAAGGTGSANTWDGTIRLSGISAPGYELPATARLDEFRASRGSRYTGTFAPPAVAPAWDTRSMVLASLGSASFQYVQSSGYPARPVGAPAGSVTYLGPSQPTDWVSPDRWLNV